LIIIT